MHKLDRIVVLRPMDGKETLSSKGGIDNRLFNGENRLHIVFDVQKGWWNLRYEKGSVPQALDMSFSEFNQAVEHIRGYFNRRNIEIVEIL